MESSSAWIVLYCSDSALASGLLDLPLVSLILASSSSTAFCLSWTTGNCLRERRSLPICSTVFFSSSSVSLPEATWASSSLMRLSRAASSLKPIVSCSVLSSFLRSLICSSRRLICSWAAVREFLPSPCFLRISLSWASSSWRRFWVGFSGFLPGVASSILALTASYLWVKALSVSRVWMCLGEGESLLDCSGWTAKCNKQQQQQQQQAT
ncbi:hypothetical protein BD289DRAFT_277878 [Coniella lustricola]|uniref:Uncharacterized protein n=1 Tax=Coniella lustricola TaxID=2025994 RepID=A0A2T3A6B1_9PEZI|nr:hypothetical protein BD289DRAFT_277878 [Coniella lustricola]